MRGNKKTKKAVKVKVVKKKAGVKRNLGVKKTAKAKKSESVYGSVRPIPEMGTRIIVKQAVEEIQPEIAETSDLESVAETELQDFEFDTEDSLVEEEAPVKNNEMTDKQKTIIMYVAVSSIMAIIVFFWVMSVKYSLGQSLSNEFRDPEASASLDKIKSSLSEIKEKIGTASDFAQTQFKEATDKVEQPQAQPNVNSGAANDFTNQLKEKLENLNANDNANTTNSN